jgi:hypothetical protein
MSGNRFVVESEPEAQDGKWLAVFIRDDTVRFGLGFQVGPGEGVVISAVCGCTKTYEVEATARN